MPAFVLESEAKTKPSFVLIPIQYVMYEFLIKKCVKSALGDKVADVKVTMRLTDTPACIVAGEGEMPLQMVKMLQAAGQEVPDVKPVFEINPEHALIGLVEKEQSDEQFAEWVDFLFDQALLAEQGQLDDPASFASKLNKLLLKLAH